MTKINSCMFFVEYLRPERRYANPSSPPLCSKEVPQGSLWRSFKCTKNCHECSIEQGIKGEAQCRDSIGYGAPTEESRFDRFPSEKTTKSSLLEDPTRAEKERSPLSTG